MHWFTLAALVAGLGACAQPHAAPAPAPQASPARTQAALDEGEVIRLERSACGFACPSYRLSLYADGVVQYTGRSHTAVIGERRAQITTASLQALRARLAAELPRVAGRYVPGEKSCGQMMTDQATVRLAVRVDDGIVASTRYGGCPAAPAALAGLETLVDDAVHSEQWLRRQAAS